jgi:hypothetical protein
MIESSIQPPEAHHAENAKSVARYRPFRLISRTAIAVTLWVNRAKILIKSLTIHDKKVIYKDGVPPFKVITLHFDRKAKRKLL